MLGLVWRNARWFRDQEIALVEGIGDQIGTAMERDQLTASLATEARAARTLRRRSNHWPGARDSRAMEIALKWRDTQTSVMIQGESGTGKKFGNLIHFNSGREDKPHQTQLRRDS